MTKTKTQAPKILLLDIETAPHRVYAWGLWGQDIHIDQIEAPGYTLCWAAKWLGAHEMMFASDHGVGRKVMLKRIYGLINEADIVVHYNGTKFDMPTLNKEFVTKGWTPPAPYKQIDLLLTARRQFRLASNKLDWVARSLGLGQKMKHKGMGLWRDCMDGDPAAWKVMERYNKRDVVLLEKVYLALRPWVVNHPNVALYSGEKRPACTNCGSLAVVKRGYYYAKSRRYRRFSCKDCGANMRARLSEKESVVELTN